MLRPHNWLARHYFLNRPFNWSWTAERLLKILLATSRTPEHTFMTFAQLEICFGLLKKFSEMVFERQSFWWPGSVALPPTLPPVSRSTVKLPTLRLFIKFYVCYKCWEKRLCVNRLDYSLLNGVRVKGVRLKVANMLHSPIMMPTSLCFWLAFSAAPLRLALR